MARRHPVNFSNFPYILARKLTKLEKHDVSMTSCHHCFVNFLAKMFPYICLQIWLGRQMSRRGSREKNYRQMYWNFKKFSSATSSKATSFKLGEYNLLPSIFRFWFTNCEKFNFGKRYLPSDSHANTVCTLIVAAFARSDKKLQKTIFPIHGDLMEANKTLRFFKEGIVN